MNWDWDKLQEQRQRQPKSKGGETPPPLGTGNIGDKFKNFKTFPVPNGKLILALVLVAWAATGIFIVSPDEEGVVLRFGKYDRIVGPGPHYRLPYPIEEALTPKVTQVQRLEVGFRSPPSSTAVQGQVRPVPEEASMLTSDENIVAVQFIVQYKIRNSREYLFNLARQSETVKNAAEAAMREVIGRSKIDAALTEGKVQIQNDAQQLLQAILDRYDSGITILAVQMQDVHAPKEVMDAFKDVASAREDKSRTINEAEAYSNKVIPEARGVAAEIINQGTAYKETVTRGAEGQSQRFLSVLTEYNKAKDITKKRMYLEAMEEVLASPGIDKIIMPKETGGRTLPFLPLGNGPSASDRQGQGK